MSPATLVWINCHDQNDLQCGVTKLNLKKFQATLERHEELTGDQEPWIRETHRATIIGEIVTREASIEEYERIKSADVEETDKTDY